MARRRTLLAAQTWLLERDVRMGVLNALRLQFGGLPKLKGTWRRRVHVGNQGSCSRWQLP